MLNQYLCKCLNKSLRYYCLAFVLISSSGCLVVEDYVKEVEASGLLAPSTADTVNAIKAALETGVGDAVGSLGKTNGFLGDTRVKIPLPEKMQNIESTLRRFGQDKLADEFVTTLNRAAEEAVTQATPVFTSAIKEMSVQDAVGIMRGGDDAATQYFKRVSTESLRNRFLPVVRKSTSDVGLTNLYKTLTQQLSLFGVNISGTDIDAYVTEKAVDGLFVYIAEEEAKIRANPIGQTSDLIKRVFSYYQ